MADMEKVTAAIDMVDELTDDELNQLVDYIRASYKNRKATRDAKARATLEVGSRVRLAGNRKPAYLTNATGVVEEFKNTRVLIKLDSGPVGKFRSGKLLTSPGGLEVI